MVTASNRVQEYSRITERLALGNKLMNLVLVAGFVKSGLAARLGNRIIPSKRSNLSERLGYTTTLAVGSFVVSLPLSFYRDYLIEHRFQLSNQTHKGWAIDQLKGEGIGLAIGLPLVEGLYWTMRRYPRYWWLIASGATIPITALFAQLAPVLILPRFFKFEPLEDQELADRLTRLAAKSGVSVAGVYQVDLSRRTTKSNAFFTGIGATKMIALGDTLLEQLSTDEIEVVIAHELGHQVHRDTWRLIGLNAVYTLGLAAMVQLFGRKLLSKHGQHTVGTNDLANIRSLPALGLIFATIGLLLEPLQLAYTRRIERQADQYALDMTASPIAFIGAMEKLSESNLSDPDPPGWIVALLYGHPPISQRIEHARCWQAVTASGREATPCDR